MKLTLVTAIVRTSSTWELLLISINKEVGDGGWAGEVVVVGGYQNRGSFY